MSHDQDFVALAFVVEASLDVSQQWRTTIVANYCMSLLRRLSEANNALAVRLLRSPHASLLTCSTDQDRLRQLCHRRHRP